MQQLTGSSALGLIDAGFQQNEARLHEPLQRLIRGLPQAGDVSVTALAAKIKAMGF